jgi:carnitine monooxygenase subunit
MMLTQEKKSTTLMKTLPYRLYTDPQVLTEEKEKIFART